MTDRILPEAEWYRAAAAVGDGRLLALSPERSDLLVVEERGDVVGVLALMEALHAECFWVAPEHRGRSSVFRRMRRALRAEALNRQAPTVLGAAMDDQMIRIMSKLGAELPGRHYVMLTEDL